MVKRALDPLVAASLLIGLCSIEASQDTRASGPGADASHARQIRRPVALACVADDQTLLVANERSGTVSVIDTEARRVLSEYKVGRGLADLAILPGGRHLLAVDQLANELLLLSCRDRSIQVIDHLKVSLDPIKVVVSFDGSSCAVASRWSRRLTFVSLAKRTSADSPGTLSTAGSLELPFCPRELAMLGNGSMLVVAEAFGGRVAVVDINRMSLESVRSLPGHNIRGLALRATDGRF